MQSLGSAERYQLQIISFLKKGRITEGGQITRGVAVYLLRCKIWDAER